jgi:hypothetical protein
MPAEFKYWLGLRGPATRADLCRQSRRGGGLAHEPLGAGGVGGVEYQAQRARAAAARPWWRRPGRGTQSLGARSPVTG